jgi:hypothetical protein
VRIERVTIGTVQGWAVRDRELILTVNLVGPIDSADFLHREPRIDVVIGEFRNGAPLGTKIEPRFDGRREFGTIEVSVLDRNVPWIPGVLEENGPRFVGHALTLRAE